MVVINLTACTYMQLETPNAHLYTITIIHVQGCVAKFMVTIIHSLMQSITGECGKMTKQKLLDDLYLNEIDANANLWQVNYERLNQTRSKWIVTRKENAPLIKSMISKINRRGPKEKGQ